MGVYRVVVCLPMQDVLEARRECESDWKSYSCPQQLNNIVGSDTSCNCSLNGLTDV